MIFFIYSHPSTTYTSMRRFIFLLSILLVMVSGAWAAGPESARKQVDYKYITYLPENYDSTKADLYPLIIYLHGRSASGTNLNSVRRYGLPFFLDRGKKLDYIVIAPQCPWGKNWASENWMDPMLDKLNRKYHIDNDRIYLTGMSLGGFGTWELANRYPNRFAAIAPMCGGGKTEWTNNIYHIPTWVFHGTQDRLIPVMRSDEMVAGLEKHQALIKYSRIPKMGHDLHRQFDNDELYQWFAQFTRRPLNEEDENSIKPMQKIELAGVHWTKQVTKTLNVFELQRNTSF